MNPILNSRTCVRHNNSDKRIHWPMWVAGLLLAVALPVLSSCATARGFGQDVETTGEKIEEAARR